MTRKLSQKDVAIIAKLRAVGYSQEEIAKVLGVAQTTVAYHIHNLRKQAEKEGADAVFAKILTHLYEISLEKMIQYLVGEKVRCRK